MLPEVGQHVVVVEGQPVAGMPGGGTSADEDGIGKDLLKSHRGRQDIVECGASPVPVAVLWTIHRMYPSTYVGPLTRCSTTGEPGRGPEARSAGGEAQGDAAYPRLPTRDAPYAGWLGGR